MRKKVLGNSFPRGFHAYTHIHSGLALTGDLTEIQIFKKLFYSFNQNTKLKKSLRKFAPQKSFESTFGFPKKRIYMYVHSCIYIILEQMLPSVLFCQWDQEDPLVQLLRVLHFLQVVLVRLGDQVYQ